MKKYGRTPESESAVALTFDWLASVQAPQDLATIAICEAWAMEPSDRLLYKVARQTINYLVYSQNRREGGLALPAEATGRHVCDGRQSMGLVRARSGGL